MDPVQTSSSYYWRGLGYWNAYFLVKFLWLFEGVLNFHPFENLVFAAFLLWPLKHKFWRILRQLIAIPVGIILAYYDTFLPRFNTIWQEGAQVMNFTPQYLWDLAGRFINWPLLGLSLIVVVAFLLASQWVRVSIWVVSYLIWLNISAPLMNVLNQWFPEDRSTNAALNYAYTQTPAASASAAPQAQLSSSLSSGSNSSPTPAASAQDKQNLDQVLQAFYDKEKTRLITFPEVLPQDAVPFDVLMINICSLSWDDLKAVGLENHPLWAKFDLLFTDFNSATAYSGPASIRLLRANCGQRSHAGIYENAPEQCYLFNQLERLGFKKELWMDHTGRFDNYLADIQKTGKLGVALTPQTQLKVALNSFDGDPVYEERQLFGEWVKRLSQENSQDRYASFMNLVALHDGNQDHTLKKPVDYYQQASKMFDDLLFFMDSLEKSGKKVMLIVVPEHGRALKGEKIQIAGLRDIPTPAITHVPVGIKFIGAKLNETSEEKLGEPSSYLAISELIRRALDQNIFSDQTVSLETLTKDLPQTDWVSENNGTLVMKHDGKTYLKLQGENWQEYVR